MRAVLVGCGKMGSAMARAWLAQDVVSSLEIIDPAPAVLEDERVRYNDGINGVIDADILILAVKPQILREAIAGLSVSPQTLVLSIAAGQSLATLEGLFGAERPIVRSMPNTPAAIGKGVSVSVANAGVNDAQKAMAARLMQACGVHEWIGDEALMDGVTALSGSGPAYVFYMIEALTKAGREIGLPDDLAASLARQTIIGSAALAESEAGTSPSVLRGNVTSPNGTTQAGLEVLMDGRFDEVMRETLEAAQVRSRELNN